MRLSSHRWPVSVFSMDESVHIVWSIVVGFIVGLIASSIMPTHLGFVGTTLLGTVGSVIGS
jgi:uncharacterized membrane protein YeaQ/YmgE (transglycosylase-associated protein family)